MPLAAAVIALAAFLLFLIQPLIGKVILPWFGGTPSVWTCVVLFFQSVLLLGYIYAHWLGNLKQGKLQPRIHLALIASALFFSAPLPDATWKPTAENHPTLHILMMLAAHLAIPGMLLASTSPLIQRWLTCSDPKKEPWRLFAFSNTGSLAALLLFPFAMEPLMGLEAQAKSWSSIFLLWCVLLIAFSLRTHSLIPKEVSSKASSKPDPSRPPFKLWIFLSLCGNALMLSITGKITLDVAAVPMLWTIPLALYLGTFIVAFDHPRWYRRSWAAAGFFLMLPLTSFVMLIRHMVPGVIQILLLLSLLFSGCMLCHGELSRHKPKTELLTRYYLSIAFGGVLGGLVVGIIAPALLNDFYEFPLSLVATAVLFVISVRRSTKNSSPIKPRTWAYIASSVFIAVLAIQQENSVLNRDAIYQDRNFFGTITIHERIRAEKKHRILRHGNIMHGMQLLNDESARRQPTINFAPESGGARILAEWPDKTSPRKIGVIGLGTGTLVTYGREGDQWVYYEIDPGMIEIARSHFTFLEETTADVTIHEGDARLVLDSSEPEEFDILIVDAFSSDSIPLHLLSEECFQIYDKHLKEGGLLLAHISNRYLDLRPVIDSAADTIGRNTLFRTYHPPKTDWWWKPSIWAVCTSDESETIKTVFEADDPTDMKNVRFTDHHAPLIKIIKR